MRVLLVTAAVFLTACVSTPERMAQRSNWDVCRFTMGGPSSGVAEQERRSRGLDCTPYYPAIQQQMANENAATQTLIQSLQRPAPARSPSTYCTSQRAGNTVYTNCN